MLLVTLDSHPIEAQNVLYRVHMVVDGEQVKTYPRLLREHEAAAYAETAAELTGNRHIISSFSFSRSDRTAL